MSAEYSILVACKSAGLIGLNKCQLQSKPHAVVISHSSINLHGNSDINLYMKSNDNCIQITFTFPSNKFDRVCLCVSDQLANIVCTDTDTSFNKFKIKWYHFQCGWFALTHRKFIRPKSSSSMRKFILWILDFTVDLILKFSRLATTFVGNCRNYYR